MTRSERKDGSDLPTSIPTINYLTHNLEGPNSATTDSTDTNTVFSLINTAFQANLGKMSRGMSPASVGSTWFSWISQLAQSPGTLLELMTYPVTHGNQGINKSLSSNCVANGEDVRFQKDCWQTMPWRFYAEQFLQLEDWWCHATKNVPGVSRYVERSVSFGARQLLDAVSPSNFVLTNPDLFHETIQSGGVNLIRGTQLAIKDTLNRQAGKPPPGAEKFIPGKEVAVTPGKIVYKNHLIELIQYEPQTKTVVKEPVLIIPAWIMKYYILDLSPENSLVNWLVAQGHTVFMVSWRNPDKKDRGLGMDDYYRLGAMDAIDAVYHIVPDTDIHLMGYCLGGTLSLITASAMAGLNDKRLKSLTILAAQGDFTEAGELMLFISKSEISFLENMMWDQGYLDTKQMAGAFQMLRSYDLIWSKMVQDYMCGEQRGMIDLLAWNADATRMPYKMHSEYLEKLFLNNDFAEDRFAVEGELVSPLNIHLPIFAVSTEKDHVAPWRSVYKIHGMTACDITFVLTSGGHNAGIVSEPHHEGRTYFIHERKEGTPYFGVNKWLKIAEQHDGSWWPAWHDWLVQHSSSKRVPSRKVDTSLPPAPGTYVMQK